MIYYTTHVPVTTIPNPTMYTTGELFLLFGYLPIIDYRSIDLNIC